MIRANPYSNEGPDTKKQHLEVASTELSVDSPISNDILSVIFSAPGWKSKDLSACSYVCKQWNQLISQGSTTVANELAEMVKNNQAFVFGKKEWETYFGKVEAEPPLPRDICQILSSDCPIRLENLGGTIGKTHMLIWVPKKVNGIPLTFESLTSLAYEPLQGKSILCNGNIWGRDGNVWHADHDNFKEKPTESNWILLTIDQLEDSRDKIYKIQEQMVTAYSEYEVPETLNMMIAMVAKLASTGRRLFSDVARKARTTRCCDQVFNNRGIEQRLIIMVGGAFTYASVKLDDHDSETGVAAARLL